MIIYNLDCKNDEINSINQQSGDKQYNLRLINELFEAENIDKVKLAGSNILENVEKLLNDKLSIYAFNESDLSYPMPMYEKVHNLESEKIR